MVRKLIKILFLLIISFNLAQENQIEKKKQELEKLKSELKQLQSELDLKSRKEKVTYDSYNNLNRQNHLLTKVIANIRSEENQKQKEIDELRKQISLIENEIREIKDNYSKYVVAVYKYGITSELESIIDAQSFNQAILRVKYLREFSKRRQADIFRLNENRDKLLAANKVLMKELEEKRILKEAKEKEIAVLNAKLSEEKKLLSALRKDKTNISKKLNDRKRAELQLRNLISKLIDESEKKEKVVTSTESGTKEKNFTANESGYDVDLSTKNFSSFSEMKGNLIWPVSRGRVVTKFGEQINRKLNTVTVSYGIDILTLGDLSVKVVAEGVVSAIEWLPGFGTIVIVSHRGGFKSVYGHLAEVYINEGDKLKTGSLIGKVGETLEGNILHFQIWSGRQSVNPEAWLRK